MSKKNDSGFAAAAAYNTLAPVRLRGVNLLVDGIGAFDQNKPAYRPEHEPSQL